MLSVAGICLSPDSSKYAAFLRNFAENHGVRRVEGKIDSVELDGESGDISCLHLKTEVNYKATSS